MMSDKLSVEAIEMLADDYERGMIGPRRLRQYFDYLIQQLAAANARIAELDKINTLQYATVGEWVERAEQAEAQCAAIADAYVKMKGDFQHNAYCKLNDSPPGDKCTCGVWEMVKAIEYADAGTAIIAELQRYREALEWYASHEVFYMQPEYDYEAKVGCSYIASSALTLAKEETND